MKKITNLFGIIFVAVGILGFIPGITSDGYLLGIFEVNALHNIIHLATGIIALMVAGSHSKSKAFFKIFGVVYGLVTVVGFLHGHSVFGLIGVNVADNLLHLVITVVALVLGFGGSKHSSSMPMSGNQMQM
ncbi:DUF4383 domain-containing protein [Candidatus Nomurabacteria bacterium]|nr:DUF4383 domain-containing protein [Candidatus Nomurabacteria bacterium]